VGTEHLAVVVAHDLDRGERRPLGAQADVGLGQQKPLVRHGFAHIGTIGAVAPVIRLDQAFAADVVGKLNGAGIQRIQILACRHGGQRMGQRRIQAGAAGPCVAACLGGQRQRFA